MFLGEHTLGFAVLLFLASLGCMFLGRFLRARRPKDTEYETGAIDGAVYGLVALLVGFTFHGAAERFQRRRELIVDEANAISTAYSRVDLVQPDRQEAMRAAFREYVKARLAVYQDPENSELTQTRLVHQEQTAQALWAQIIASLHAPDAPIALAMVVPVNEMLDMANTRVNLVKMHPPRAVYGLLIVACLIASLLVGFGLKSELRLRLHMVLYAGAMASTLFVILELEFPRLGFIRVDAMDAALVQQLEAME